MSNNYKGKNKKDNSKDRKTRGKYGRSQKDTRDPITSTGLDNSGRDNDPNDYFTSKELAEQASQLSFQNMLGLGSFNDYEIPTICRIDFNASPGISFEILEAARYELWKDDQSSVVPQAEFTDVRAGLNMMCMKLYTLLATFSGRTSNYGPQDVGVMILAIAAVSELSEHLRRMFGVALTYNARNRTMPVELLRSMGIDPVDFMANIADYRMRFNIEMSRINQIPLLDNVGFIRKSRDMYQKIYQDDPSSMAQLFYWAPYSAWVIDETSMQQGSILVAQPVGNRTFSQLLDLLDSQITALLESTTLNLIYADLLNLGNKLKVPTWQFDYLAENYVVMPEYNATASLQFHNSNILGAPAEIGASLETGLVTVASWDKVQFTRGNHVYTDAATNSLVYNPVFPGLYKARPSTIIDMNTDNPTVVDRIEALRMSCVPSGWYAPASAFGGTSQTIYGIMPTLADHYVVRLVVFKNKANSNVRNITKYAFRKDVDSEALFSYIQSALNAFKDAPIIEYYDTLETYNMRTIYMTGNVSFYTEIGYDYLRRVNSLMYVGLFDFRV